MCCVAIWIWISGLTYWNLNSSSKIFVQQWLLGLTLVYCSQEVKWCTFQKDLSYYYSYTKAYLYLQSLVMYGNIFNMTEIEVAERYGKFSDSKNLNMP